MPDLIYEAFLKRQFEEAMTLAAESDLLDLIPVEAMLMYAAPRESGQAQPVEPPLVAHYLAHFTCKGLVRLPEGAIAEAELFTVGFAFPSDYLRRANPFEVVNWFGPPNVWHPNVSDQAPAICLGRVVPGTPLVDLLYRAFEVITYANVTMREDDALNKAACVWARANVDRFPIDRRPLKRRPVEFRVTPVVVSP